MKSRQYLAVLRNQQGMALILSVLILVAATVVALSLGLDTTLETRIAGNQKSMTVAFLNADAGLQEAQVSLASAFSNAPMNLARIRNNSQPNWTFLFVNGTPNPAVAKDPDIAANEVRVLNSSTYKVYASNPGYPAANGAILTVRSIGFDRSGARQVVEESLIAEANGSRSGYYAQQGGGSTKNNSNQRDRGTVNYENGAIAPGNGLTLR